MHPCILAKNNTNKPVYQFIPSLQNLNPDSLFLLFWCLYLQLGALLPMQKLFLNSKKKSLVSQTSFKNSKLLGHHFLRMETSTSNVQTSHQQSKNPKSRCQTNIMVKERKQGHLYFSVTQFSVLNLLASHQRKTKSSSQFRTSRKQLLTGSHLLWSMNSTKPSFQRSKNSKTSSSQFLTIQTERKLLLHASYHSNKVVIPVPNTHLSFSDLCWKLDGVKSTFCYGSVLPGSQ